MHDYCEERGMTFQIRQVQAVWPNGKYEEYRLHCFAGPAEAEAFLDHFQGEVFDAKRNREKGKMRGVWRRSDEYRRIPTLARSACLNSCATEAERCADATPNICRGRKSTGSTD